MQVPDVTASYLIITTSRWICRGIAALGDGASIVFGPSKAMSAYRPLHSLTAGCAMMLFSSLTFSSRCPPDSKESLPLITRQTQQPENVQHTHSLTRASKISTIHTAIAYLLPQHVQTPFPPFLFSLTTIP